MIWLFAVVAAVAVVAVAVITVNRVVVELSGHAAPSVLDVDRAVSVIADALPYEVAARLSHDDVHTIVVWQLDHYRDVGLTSEYGEELAGEGALRSDGEAVADADAAVDAVVARALSESDFDAVDVVVVLDELMKHLVDIGAVGPPA